MSYVPNDFSSFCFHLFNLLLFNPEAEDQQMDAVIKQALSVQLKGTSTQ